MTLRTRKSPCANRSWYSLTTRPKCSPRCTSCCSLVAKPSKIVFSCNRAGLPPNSWTRLPSAFVTTKCSPMGRHPCDTTVVAFTGPLSSTAAAPLRNTR